MILCVCQGVTEREIGETIAGGAASVEAVVRQCGAGGDCGSCHDEIRQLLHSPGPSSRLEVAA